MVDTRQLPIPGVTFSSPQWGWIKLTIDGLISRDMPAIRISEVWDPLPELLPFLEAMHADRDMARWDVDEEGRHAQLLFVPSIASGLLDARLVDVPAQLLLIRDGGAHHFGLNRIIIGSQATALAIYRAFRAMADDPARDLRHWELPHLTDKDDPMPPEHHLSRLRSVRLDSALAQLPSLSPRKRRP